MACAALRHRLLTIWWIWFSSAATKTGSSGRWNAISTPLPIVGRQSSIAAATAVPMSIATRGDRSLLLKVRISATS